MHASAFAAMLIEATFRFETLTGCRDDCGHVQLVCYAKMRAEQLHLRSEGHALWGTPCAWPNASPAADPPASSLTVPPPPQFAGPACLRPPPGERRPRRGGCRRTARAALRTSVSKLRETCGSPEFAVNCYAPDDAMSGGVCGFGRGDMGILSFRFDFQQRAES